MTATPSKFSSVAFLAGLAANHYQGASKEYSEEETLDLLARKRDTLIRVAAPDPDPIMVHPTKSVTECEWMDLMGKPLSLEKEAPKTVVLDTINPGTTRRKCAVTPPPPNFWMRFMYQRDLSREMLGL